jgi:hypothetical protein
MAIHFEELWEKCENFQKEINSNGNSQSLIDELMFKINLYKAIDAKTEMPEEDRQKIKFRTLGEVLLTLTGLSFKDNINVYDALNTALLYRSVDHYNQKHSND